MPSISAEVINNAIVKTMAVYVGISQPISAYLGARDAYLGAHKVNPSDDYLATMVVTGSTIIGGLAGTFLAPISLPIHFYRQWSKYREEE